MEEIDLNLTWDLCELCNKNPGNFWEKELKILFCEDCRAKVKELSKDLAKEQIH